MLINHRGYNVENTTGKYVARHEDGDELQIFSMNLPRLLKALDDIWNTASQITSLSAGIDFINAPRWMREWLENPTKNVDLDAAYRRGAC